MKITRMKINGIETPMGFANETLDVSWNVEEAVGKYAIQVKIEAALDETFQEIVYAAENKNFSCTGTRLEMVLKPRTRYFVRITVTDEMGESASGITWFETGKMDEEWIAEWISPTEEDLFHPIMRKKFCMSKPFINARLYICGLGVYESYLNGTKTGHEILAPFINDYRFALQAQTYDITEQLREKNVIEIQLGNGWYKGRFGQAGKTYGNRFAAIAELHILYKDGSEEIIVTDNSWEYRSSDIENSGIYDGEILNRLLWEGKDNDWKHAVPIVLDKKLLTDRYSIPVIVKEKLEVKEVITTPFGETVLDMGQNFTGWLVFQSRQPKGARIHLEFGEVLQDGNFYNENYRTAKGGFLYISDGREELVRPHFTFFGFRYVRITGWNGELKPEDFTGYVIYSDLEQTGFLKTGNQKVNQLISNCLWGQKSNFLDMPTDCPQRDERLGWTADAQVFSPTATYNMDTRAFYRKYLWDMHNVQNIMNGAVPAYLPASEGMCPVCSVWGDAATFIPYTLWKFYENPGETEIHYSMMKDWVEYIASEMRKHYKDEVGIWDFTFHFGDWLALDGPDEQSVKGGTSDGYLATAHYYKSASIVAEIGGKLKKYEEQKRYEKLAAKIKELLLFEYFTPAGHLSINTQAAYVVALKFGIYRDKDVLLQDFLELLKAGRYKIKCGFVGAPLLCQVLSENGYSELAYKFLLQEDFPSWLYAVNLGATTIWERWNSLLPDGKISGTGMNSLNHYSYGSVVEFLYAYAAGLRPADAGFKTAIIEPNLNGNIRRLNLTYISPAGTYVVVWNLTDEGSVKIHLEIPFGCRAYVSLPDSRQEKLDLNTGVYDYEYIPLHDYRQKYDESTSLKTIFEDSEAKEVLLRCVPNASMLDNPIDAEENLEVLYERDFLGIRPEEAEKAIEEIKKIKNW